MTLADMRAAYAAAWQWLGVLGADEAAAWSMARDAASGWLEVIQ